MSSKAEVQLLRQLISLKDNAANVDDFLRTNNLDDFRHRSATAATTDFFTRQWGKVQDSFRINHSDEFRTRSVTAEKTDFFKGQCSKRLTIL